MAGFEPSKAHWLYQHKTPAWVSIRRWHLHLSHLVAMGTVKDKEGVWVQVFRSSSAFFGIFSRAVARPVFNFLRRLLETCLYPCVRWEGSSAGIWLLGLSLSESRRGLLCSCATLALGASSGHRAACGLGKDPEQAEVRAQGREKCILAFLYVCSPHGLSYLCLLGF